MVYKMHPPSGAKHPFVDFGEVFLTSRNSTVTKQFECQILSLQDESVVRIFKENFFGYNAKFASCIWW